MQEIITKASDLDKKDNEDLRARIELFLDMPNQKDDTRDQTLKMPPDQDKEEDWPEPPKNPDHIEEWDFRQDWEQCDQESLEHERKPILDYVYYEIK